MTLINQITGTFGGSYYITTSGTSTCTGTSNLIHIQSAEETSRIVKITLLNDDGTLWACEDRYEFPIDAEIPLEGESTHDILMAFLAKANNSYYAYSEIVIEFYLDDRMIGDHTLTPEEYTRLREEAKKP